MKEAEFENTFKPIVEPLKEIMKNVHSANSRNTADVNDINNIVKSRRRRLQFQSPAEEKLVQKESFDFSSPESIQPTDEDASFRTPVNFNIDNLNQSTPYNRPSPSDSNRDKIYGPYFDVQSNSTKLGRSSFIVNEQKNFIIDGEIFSGTAGLYELIFRKIPRRDRYVDEDLDEYLKILQKTKAHLKNYDSNSQVKGNRGHKYKHIIQPLLQRLTQRVIKKIGKAYNNNSSDMMYSNNPVDYVYWDNPDELVDRLRLLIASQKAGNNNLQNEINSIVEELRESKIIY